MLCSRWVSLDSLVLCLLFVGCDSQSGAHSGVNQGIEASVPAPILDPHLNLVCLQSEVNFGIVSQHAKCSGDVLIFNPTESSARLVGIEQGCTCTDAGVESAELDPGMSTKLHVAVSTTRIGEHAANVKLIPTAPFLPLIVRVRWRVEGRVEVSPTQLSFGHLSPGVQKEAVIQIVFPEVGNGYSSVDVPKVVSTTPKLTVTIAPREQGLVALIKLCDSDASSGLNCRERITFEFPPPIGEVVVPVDWRISEGIIAIPPSLAIRGQDSSNYWEKVVFLRSLSSEIVSASVEHIAFSVDGESLPVNLLTTSIEKGRLRLSISSSFPASSEPFSGVLRISSTINEAPHEVELKVAGIMERGGIRDDCK